MAAAIIGYDRYFGLSTGWMRYIVTQFSLEKSLKEFQYDWIILVTQQQDNVLTLLQRIKEFSLHIDMLVRQETDAWVTEFQSNFSELEKTLRTDIGIKKLGNIKVEVSNSRHFDRVEIRLNDSHIKDLIGVTECILDLIPPGGYEITAIGKKDNKEAKESKVIEVQPSLTTSVQLTLPSS